MRRRKRKDAEKKGKVEMRILYIPMQYLKYPTRSKIKKKNKIPFQPQKSLMQFEVEIQSQKQKQEGKVQVECHYLLAKLSESTPNEVF